MRFFINYFRQLFALLMFMLLGTAHAQQFVSLHQFPISYNISSFLDSQGNINYTKTPELFGFKNQFSPSGITGCVIGFPEFRNLCEKVKGGFDFVFENEYVDFNEFRVFIPAGTTFFALRGFLPQATPYAAAVRLGQPPTRFTMLSAEDYQDAKVNQNEERDFSRLLQGEERILVHDGSGVMKLSGTARLYNKPMEVGQWLYVRALNGSPLFSLGAVYEVDLERYRSGYNMTQFDGSGDPLQTSQGSSGFQDFILSSSSWTVGSNSFSLNLTATAQQQLPTNCTVSPSGVLSIGSVQGSTAPVTINMTAAEALANNRNDFVFNCGGKTKTFTILRQESPPIFVGATATVTATITDHVPTLSLKVKHPASEVAQGGSVKYFVVGLIPAQMFAEVNPWVIGEIPFFLSDFPDGKRWTLLFQGQGFQEVAFDKNGFILNEEQESIEIPLIFTMEELKAIKVKIRFGYTINDGLFRAMDVIWDPKSNGAF